MRWIGSARLASTPWNCTRPDSVSKRASPSCKAASVARCNCDAPGPAAEKGRVEIEFEYLRFRERALEPRRDDHFPHLALVGDILAHQKILHHLLGDGRAALRTAGLRQIAEESPDQGA